MCPHSPLELMENENTTLEHLLNILPTKHPVPTENIYFVPATLRLVLKSQQQQTHILRSVFLLSSHVLYCSCCPPPPRVNLWSWTKADSAFSSRSSHIRIWTVYPILPVFSVKMTGCVNWCPYGRSVRGSNVGFAWAAQGQFFWLHALDVCCAELSPQSRY